MNKTYDEMMTEFKTLMRCQLYALPNGRELYERIIPQMSIDLKDINELKLRLERTLIGRFSTVDYWCYWRDTKEGYNFWSRVDCDILREIRKKQTPWLTTPPPTFIEVDE